LWIDTIFFDRSLKYKFDNIDRSLNKISCQITHIKSRIHAKLKEGCQLRGGIMSDGHILQWDAAYNLYHRPADRFVADFVGEGVFLPGEVLSPRQMQIELGILDGKIPAECIAGCSQGCIVKVLLRPDDIVHDDASDMKAEIVTKAFRGAEFLYTLRLDSSAIILSLMLSHHDHAIGERIGIRLDVDHVVAFHSEKEHMRDHRNFTDMQSDAHSCLTPIASGAGDVSAETT
jgi:ABC-type Fe3+/spermidine/putrescine transport system ATPase subunit